MPKAYAYSLVGSIIRDKTQPRDRETIDEAASCRVVSGSVASVIEGGWWLPTGQEIPSQPRLRLREFRAYLSRRSLL